MRLTLLCVGTLFLLTLPAQHHNPPVTPAHSLEAHVTVPDKVQVILTKACSDCHSSATHWPWYANLPLASKLIEDDVKHGRAVMNFSEWSDSKGLEIGVLLAACSDVKAERMPPQKYRTIHPSADLTAAEQNTLCNWTTAAVRELRSR